MRNEPRPKKSRRAFLNLLASTAPGADEAAATFIDAKLKFNPVIPETAAAGEVGGKLTATNFRVHDTFRTAYRNA